jgi:ParB family transcriptional regulator, chromosome partitioning protein
MGKLDDLKRTGMANAFESMGAFAPAPAVGVMPTASASKHDGVTRAKNVCVIPLDKIARDPNQPREEFDPDALRRLADSLKERGQLQPIGVRWDEALGVYVIVFGERRWRAAGMAGIPTVNALVMEGAISPEELIVVQLVENAVREDLRPIEQARAYRKLMDAKGCSARQIARELAVDQARVVRALALLELPETVQAQVEQGAIPPTTAYEISKAEPDRQEELARRVVIEGLRTADVTEARKPKSDRPRKFKAEIKIPGGIVMVNLDEPEPSDEEVIAALQAAVKRFKKNRSSRTEAA